jgi:hypothetical protein
MHPCFAIFTCACAFLPLLCYKFRLQLLFVTIFSTFHIATKFQCRKHCTVSTNSRRCIHQWKQCARRLSFVLSPIRVCLESTWAPSLWKDRTNLVRLSPCDCGRETHVLSDAKNWLRGTRIMIAECSFIKYKVDYGSNSAKLKLFRRVCVDVRGGFILLNAQPKLNRPR